MYDYCASFTKIFPGSLPLIKWPYGSRGYFWKANCSKSLLLEPLMAHLHIWSVVDIPWQAASGPFCSLFWHGFPLPTLPSSHTALTVPPLEILSTSSGLLSALQAFSPLSRLSSRDISPCTSFQHSRTLLFVPRVWVKFYFKILCFFLKLFDFSQ